MNVNGVKMTDSPSIRLPSVYRPRVAPVVPYALPRIRLQSAAMTQEQAYQWAKNKVKNAKNRADRAYYRKIFRFLGGF